MAAPASGLGLVEATSPIEGIRVLTFNRPQKRNALSKDLIAEFLAQLSAASSDPQVRIIILTGAGAFFSGKFFLYFLHTNLQKNQRTQGKRKPSRRAV